MSKTKLSILAPHPHCCATEPLPLCTFCISTSDTTVSAQANTSESALSLLALIFSCSSTIHYLVPLALSAKICKISSLSLHLWHFPSHLDTCSGFHPCPLQFILYLERWMKSWEWSLGNTHKRIQQNWWGHWPDQRWDRVHREGRTVVQRKRIWAKNILKTRL